ncbi:flavocytochrome c [Ferrimonas senticii]|uniref:flavocytochrome c n=1 Tax=Ferrimonas senticii TaxID=394566 RepID=UPI00146C58EC|nr:flavocytochrome c [Ferrimonas senticii]
MKLGAGVGFSLTAGSVVAQSRTEASVDYHQTYDTVIVGSGLAGLSAAIEAAVANKRVLVIEKMPAIGGNSAINGGVMAVANHPLQKKNNIVDSVELMLNDMLVAGEGLGDRKLVEMVARESYASYQFAIESGAEFSDVLLHHGGHSVPRLLKTKHSVGGDITFPLYQRALKAGVDFAKKTNLRQILTNESGAVEGIVIESGYDYRNKQYNEVSNVQITKALIIASGGFANDVAFRMVQQPRIDHKFPSTNQPGGSADALRCMLDLGAWPVQLSFVQMGPWTIANEKGFGHTPFNGVGAFASGLTIDRHSGRRFFNEMGNRKQRADAIMTRVDEKGNPRFPISFAAQSAVDAYPDAYYILDSALHHGVVKRFETLQAMADFYQLPFVELQDEVQKFNGFIDQKNDKNFGRVNIASVPKLLTGPYYACELWPKVHYTMGGVKINEFTQVINVKTGQAIPKLYAAGEVTGGIHGATRLGGCAIAEAITTGRMAGKQACKVNS